jgi:hypothetical protein
VARVLSEDVASFYGALQRRRLPPLRTTVPADRRMHKTGPLRAPRPLETDMLVSLTFIQVREAGLFAFREDHLLYTPTLDAILTTSSRDDDEEQLNGHLDVRSSSLRGDEPGLRIGWHHLRECRCVHCRAARLQLLHDDA